MRVSQRDLQTVRPRWVCGTQEEVVDRETADQENAPSLLEVKEEDPEEECAQRRLRTMLDPKLTVPHTCRTGIGARIVCEAEARRWTKGAREQPKRSLPEYHMDHCFPGGQKLTILVVVERHSKMKKAVVVPSKGSTGRYAARKVLDLIEECGDEDRAIIVKSDRSQRSSSW